ncbi:MAG: hypothetical protein JWQ38_3494 [Flavipsychrobacter sp.]|nr:hypothetical protein [Flavipsychrobacter sp.]
MTEKRRIAFLCHPYHRGGVTRWMADAAITLASKGHTIYFITVEPVKEFFSAKGKETMLQLLAKDGNKVNVIKSSAGYEFEFGTDEYRAYVYKKLLARLPAGTPVILSDSAPTWDAATALYGSYPVVGVLHADEKHYYNLAAKYHSRIDILVCVSKRVSRIVKELVPAFSPKHLYTIPCGIALATTHPSNYNSNDTLRLVYVGRISNYQKRTGDLLKIAVELAKNNTKFHLDIIGDGATARTTLEQGLKDAGLSDRVTFWGWLSQQEVARHLAVSDILILTSDFEGTPIAMMEALAAGCSVVGTRVSGIEDYEHHALASDCYRVFEVGDIADAIAKINDIAAVPKDKRAVASRKLAEMEFTMQVCLDRYLDVIAHIPEKNTPVPEITLSFSAMLYSRAIALARYSKLKLSGK